MIGRLSVRLRWPAFSYAALAAGPLMVLSGAVLLTDEAAHVLVGWGAVPWALFFVGFYYLLYCQEERWPGALVRAGHAAITWTLLALVSVEAAWLARDILDMPSAWQALAWPLPLLAAVSVLLRATATGHWPAGRFGAVYLELVAVPAAGLLWVWALAVCTLPGEPIWFPYVPLLNPIELGQVVAVLLGIGAGFALRRNGGRYLPPPAPAWLAYPAACMGFVVLDSVIARSVHHWSGVPYTLSALVASPTFHSAISVVWTGLALGVMMWATRRGWRRPWIGGATILGVVVVKLFLVDLAGIDTVARIISFLLVGVLTLVIGYFSPLPPLHNGGDRSSRKSPAR